MFKYKFSHWQISEMRQATFAQAKPMRLVKMLNTSFYARNCGHNAIHSAVD